MPQLTIVPHGDSAAVVLPAKVLESVGLRIGDVVDVTVGDRQLILRPGEDAARRALLEEIAREVVERRRDAYRRLVGIQSLEAEEHDSLVDELLQSDPAFQTLVAKSQASPRRPFPPGTGT
ncbi:MAG TPA: AbrB/MazE/SpoVT family DNA-binding domain-containing protein [Gemmataceae bacterium]|nr:AbrB/MazE/SpoVT family DNA-binding domain-containing protein [Gemmataceae bacterium]